MRHIYPKPSNNQQLVSKSDEAPGLRACRLQLAKPLISIEQINKNQPSLPSQESGEWSCSQAGSPRPPLCRQFSA